MKVKSSDRLENCLILSFCLLAGRLRPYNATPFNLLRKISYGFFSISASLKADCPKVAYVRTGEKAINKKTI